MRWYTLFLLPLLFGCGQPMSLGGSITTHNDGTVPTAYIAQKPQVTRGVIAAPTPDTTMSLPADFQNPDAPKYEGDSQHSITITPGATVTVENKYLGGIYTFQVQIGADQGIHVTSNSPNVYVRNNGTGLVSLVDNKDPNHPIVWVRYTPNERILVAQFYDDGYITTGSDQ